MYDLLLINPSVDVFRYRDPGYVFPWVDGGHDWTPQPMLFLAPYVKRHGFSVKVIDMEIYPSSQEKDLLNRYVPLSRFIGISAMTIQIPHVLSLLKRIKKLSPEKPVVLGGVHATLLPDQTVGDPLVDYVVVGEGEEPLVCLLSGEDHKRIGSKQKLADFSGVDRFLPPEKTANPDYSCLEMDRYFEFQGKDFRNIDILTSRGCPFKCSFCINTIMKNTWRGFSVERSIAIINDVYERYKVKHIFMLDEYFFGRKERARQIIEHLAKLAVTWETSVTVKSVLALDDSFLRFISQSGCLRLRMGAESASDRLLVILRKNITKEQIVKARDRCLEFGITPSLSFMTDLSDELPAEKEATIKLAQECKNVGALVQGPQPFRPYPGSEEYSKLVKRGLKIPQRLADWESCKLYNTNREIKRSIFEPVTRRYKPVIKHLLNRYAPQFIGSNSDR